MLKDDQNGAERMPKWDKAPPKTPLAWQEQTLYKKECENDANGNERGAKMVQEMMHELSKKLRQT